MQISHNFKNTLLADDGSLSDISLETGLNAGIFEAEIEVGTGNVIQGTVYIEQPGWVVFKKQGYGFDLHVGPSRYVAACNSEVQKRGGYERYGKWRLSSDYVFGGVLMTAENETQLRSEWNAQYCNFSHMDPECQMYVLE